MSTVANLQPEPAPVVACTISRDVQNFELLIDDMERELGENWGDLSFDDALIFLQQPDSDHLKFVAVAVDGHDEADLTRITEVIRAAKAREVRVILIAAEVGPVASPHVDQRARGQQVASVPIHSLRRPGVIARQETILSGPGESLSIVHDTTEPALAYAPGIRIALDAARDATGVIVGLDSLLDLGIGTPRGGSDAPVDEGGVPGQVASTTSA